MNQPNLVEKALWTAGTVALALILVFVFHVGGKSGTLGSSGAGITNLSGLSIDGSSPGTLTVAGATTLTGAITLTGASAHTGLATFNGGELFTNTNSTTTMTATETLVVADLANYDTVIMSPNVAGNTTLTLFASSTAATWLPTAGNRQRVCIINATTTAGTLITFAGGTGTKLLVASSSASALGSVALYPQKMGCFDFARASATLTTFDILGGFTAYQ